MVRVVIVDRTFPSCHVSILAIEAQTFSMQEPGYFFSIYSPPRTEAGYKLARQRLEEDLKFTSKMASFSPWLLSRY
jgi:hypothetical protein